MPMACREIALLPPLILKIWMKMDISGKISKNVIWEIMGLSMQTMWKTSAVMLDCDDESVYVIAGNIKFAI